MAAGAAGSLAGTIAGLITPVGDAGQAVRVPAKIAQGMQHGWDALPFASIFNSAKTNTGKEGTLKDWYDLISS